MKVLYVIDQKVESGKTSGIIYKIKNKIEIWDYHGIQVELLSLYDFKLYSYDLKVIDSSKSINIKRHGRYFTLIRMLLSTLKLYFFLSKNNYDIMYIRQRPYMPFLGACMRKLETIIELNTNDVEEYKVISGLMYKINNMTREKFYRGASAFVSVSNELTKYYTKEFKKPNITIGNGINAAEYEVVNNSNERPQLVFVGSPGFPWHGIEKVVLLAKKIPDFDFHLVGFEGKDTENLKYHGYCSLRKTKEIVGMCDVGIATLSLYTKNMNEASPLKSRQYLAQGLPVIYAYDDTDLSGVSSFSLKIENDKDNISKNIRNITKFVKDVHNNTKIREEARQFALNHLDVKAKEKQRILFFEKINKRVK